MTKKSVLLVEDEILLCWVVEDALRECGHEVVTLTTGSEGLKALEGSRSFDALVTNIKLPDGPDGWALARRARELDPSIAVLYVSGDSIARHDDDGVEGSKMLAKPFDPDKLCDTLAGIMGCRA
jgi:two-component system, cell cycle response regulator CpdR